MQIILLQAERAWAYAMDLKQFANTESRKQVWNILTFSASIFTHLISFHQNLSIINTLILIEYIIARLDSEAMRTRIGVT